jgi:hypothetical protein
MMNGQHTSYTDFDRVLGAVADVAGDSSRAYGTSLTLGHQVRLRGLQSNMRSGIHPCWSTISVA